MRILRLVDPDRYAVEFHPYITVLAGADEEQRRAIVAAFEAVAAGQATVLQGLIEVHGVVLDLDEHALDLLDLDDADVDVCVRADELPGNNSGGVERQVREAERRLQSLEQPRRDRQTALEAAAAASERALAALAAQSALTAQAETSAVPDPAVARSALAERRADLQAERDRLAVVLDPGAASALDEARVRLDAVAPDPTDAPSPIPISDPVPDPIPVPVPVLVPDPDGDPDRLGDLRAALSLHRLYDPSPVRSALDEVRAGRTAGDMEPSTEALSLVDRLDGFDREIASLDAEVASAPTSAEVEAAKERVDQLRLRLREQERLLEAQDDGASDIQLLEQAHLDVERARDAVGGRFGRARAQARVDAAVAAEAEILGRLGLTSYTEFLTLGGSGAPGQHPTHEIDAARAAVAQAEAEAAQLDRRASAAIRLAELVEDRGRARDQARALLEDPNLADEAITSALVQLRVPADDTESIETLVEVLETVGLSVRGLDLSPAEVETMTADWLAEHQHTEARLSRLIDELEGRIPPDEEPSSLEPTEASEVEDRFSEARAVVAAAQARVMAHEAAASALADVEAALAEVEEALDHLPVSQPDHADSSDGLAAAEAAASAQATVAELAAAVDATETEYHRAVEELAALRHTLSELEHEPPPVNEIEWYLLARLAAQRNQSFVGSLPLVIVGALDDVDDDDGMEHLLDRLERMAGAVQIVHITDDPRILGWADGLDDDRAAVVRPEVARTSGA